MNKTILSLMMFFCLGAISGCVTTDMYRAGPSWTMMDGRGNWINDAGENAKPSQIIDCENKSEKYLNWGWVPLVSGWGMAHGQFEKCMRDNGFIWKID